MPNERRLGLRAVCIVLVASSWLAACGSVDVSENEPPTSPATGAPPSNPTPTPTPTPTPPPPNQPPRIAGSPPTSIAVGRLFDFQPTASDPEGAALRFRATGLPSWLAVDAATGTIRGTPSASNVGSSTITLFASDGAAEASLSFSVTVLQAADGRATVTWTAPTTRTDGTPLQNLAGFRVYFGTRPDALVNRVDVNLAGATSAVIENLTPGTWHFVATAVDANGVESARSAAASKTIS